MLNFGADIAIAEGHFHRVREIIAVWALEHVVICQHEDTVRHFCWRVSRPQFFSRRMDVVAVFFGRENFGQGILD